MTETLISEIVPGAAITTTKIEIPLPGIQSALAALNIPGITFNPATDAEFEPIMVALFFIMSRKLTTAYRNEDTVNRQLVIEMSETIRQEQDDNGNYYNTIDVISTLYSPSNISIGNLFSPSKF